MKIVNDNFYDAADVIKDRGYRLVPVAVVKGSASSSEPLSESPCYLEKCSVAEVLAKAREIIDAKLVAQDL